MMMNMKRRDFLERGVKTVMFLPFVNLVACSPGKTSRISPEESLKKLIMILGPWSREDEQMAQDFIRRFMQVDAYVDMYLSRSGKVIQDIASGFPDETSLEIENINLEELSSEEREILLTLTNQIYSFNEVQFYGSNVPPWGQCIGYPMWHTKAPKI